MFGSCHVCCGLPDPADSLGRRRIGVCIIPTYVLIAKTLGTYVHMDVRKIGIDIERDQLRPLYSRRRAMSFIT